MTQSALAQARDMRTLILEHRDETEANRRIAKPIVLRLMESGLCRMPLAKAHGGLELSPVEMLDVLEALARAEASVAWIAWNSSLACHLGRHLSPPARDTIFADPSWIYADSLAPSGKAEISADGFVLNGRWSIVSGCELAEWIAVSAFVSESGQMRMTPAGVPEQRFLFVRKGAFDIIDTWNVGGMRGTGSHDVVMNNLRVPRELSCAATDPSSVDGPLGRVPGTWIFAGFAAQAIGIAAQSVDTLTALAKTKPPRGMQAALKERASVQGAIAGHTAALAAARAHLKACVAQQWDKVVSGDAQDLEAIADVHAAAQHANAIARAAVDAVYEAAGTSALYANLPLERAHRDMYAMMRHICGSGNFLEEAGRVALGLKPQNPFFLV